MSTQHTGSVTLVVNNISQLQSQQIDFPFCGLSYFGIYQTKSGPPVEEDNVFVYWYKFKKDKICAKVHFNVSILSESGEKLYNTEYNYEFNDANEHPLVTLISRAKLLDPKNGYLVNDKLTLLCEAETIEKNKEPKNLDFTAHQKMCNLSENLESLLSDGKFSDATLIVGSNKKKFPVHKAILSARSSVFAAMFEHDCEEKRQNEVKITDIDPETCDELLRYIYTGKVKQMDRYALDLLQAADKYQLESLKKMAEDFLCSTLSVETAANILFVADLHGTTKLKDKCLEYISSNANQVKATDGWKVLESNAKLLGDLFFYSANKNK